MYCTNKATRGLICDEHVRRRKAAYMKRTKGMRRLRCSTCGNLGHNRTTCKEGK